MMRLSTFLCLLAVMLATGCAPGRHEAAVSTQQAQHATEAQIAVLQSQDTAAALEALTPEQRAPIEAVIRKVYSLAQSATVALVPVVNRFAIDEPEAKATTSSAQAAADPPAFAAAVALQSELTAKETEDARKASEWTQRALAFGLSVADSWFAKVGLGGGTATLLFGYGIKLWRDRKSYQTAFRQTVQGLDLARASLQSASFQLGVKDLWDAHVAPALEDAQDQAVKVAVSALQPPKSPPPQREPGNSG